MYLGGVHFAESRKGLDGHSDADVVCHAICDALLGAAALGDIGEHFPDTDPQYEGTPGVAFLDAVRDKLAEKRFRIVNVDCTVMSDAVRLGAAKHAMASTVASHLGIDATQVSIKATTWEGFGPVGRGEIIACQAIAAIAGGD